MFCSLLLSLGTDPGYLGVSLIGAGVGISLAVLLLLLAAFAVAYHSRPRKRCKTRNPRATVVNSDKHHQTEATLITPDGGGSILMGSSETSSGDKGDTWCGILNEKSSLFAAGREPDVIRSVDTKSNSNLKEDRSRYPPLILSPLQVTN